MPFESEAGPSLKTWRARATARRKMRPKAPRLTASMPARRGETQAVAAAARGTRRRSARIIAALRYLFPWGRLLTCGGLVIRLLSGERSLGPRRMGTKLAGFFGASGRRIDNLPQDSILPHKHGSGSSAEPPQTADVHGFEAFPNPVDQNAQHHHGHQHVEQNA